jgi:micrococcal nuclease
MSKVTKSIVFGTIGITLLVIWFIPYIVANDISLICFGERGDCFTGKITRIIDGNTIKVNDIPIRLALVLTPDLEENGGIEAKQFVEQTCPVGSIVIVDEDDYRLEGVYDKMIAEIQCGDIMLNSAILENQFGKIDTSSCLQSEFSTEEWTKKFGC